MTLKTFKKTLLFTLMTGFILGGCSSSKPSSSADGTKTIKVLFIGNSLTYTNDIPGTLKDLAASSTAYRFDVDSVTEGGAFINKFLEGGESSRAYTKIMSSKWDFVVLQQQSGSQFDYINKDYTIRNNDFDFYMSLPDPAKTSTWCKTNRSSVLCTYERLIRSQSAEPVFYMHWIYDSTPAYGIITGGAFIFAAQKLNAVLAPVGVSYFNLLNEGYTKSCDATECILSDTVHPAPLGAYAAASVFYATLTNTSPVGLIPLQGLSAQSARKVQEVAWSSYLSVKNNLFSLSDTVTVLNSSSEWSESTYGPTTIPRCLTGEDLGHIEDLYKNNFNPITPALHNYIGALSTQSTEDQCYHFVD